MAYSTNPNLPKARALALKLHIYDGLPLQVVANRCGVHRSTIYRWKLKWFEINKDRQFGNFNRPTRVAGKTKYLSCKWFIPTLSSKPNHSPSAVPEKVIELILSLRNRLKRCAEIIWYHLTTDNGVDISLSSVRRILKRHCAFDGSRKNRVRPDNPRRPHPTRPGELVQTDTIHYVCPNSYKRRYVYTVIDLYSRIAYAEMHHQIRPGIAAKVIQRAQEAAGFRFSMVQADNGLEFSRYFEQNLLKQNIQLRHSRLGRPNDNAHIERFNRTIQEECLGNRLSSSVATATLQVKINRYIEYYNTKRIHLGLQLQTPTSMLQSS